jgi:hypothetical protein
MKSITSKAVVYATHMEETAVPQQKLNVLYHIFTQFELAKPAQSGAAVL